MTRAEDDVRKMASGLRYVVRHRGRGLQRLSLVTRHFCDLFASCSMPDVGIEVVAAAARNPLASLHERR